MLKDVSISVVDGAMLSAAKDGVHVKIGVSPVETTEAIIIKNTYSVNRIHEMLGHSPLADACIDSIENGSSLIYCIPVPAVANGVVSEIKKEHAVESGTVQITGNPNNRYEIGIIITKGGGLNEAAFKYTIDGGITYSDEITVPYDGEFEATGTGLNFVFALGAEESPFSLADAFTASTTAPQSSNEMVLKAVDKVRGIRAVVEFVHIVGESTKALWAALAYEAEQFFSVYYKPLYFVCEARSKTESETLREYVDSLVAERKAVNSYFVQVVAATGVYNRKDRTTQIINLASIAAGLYAKATVQQSISETRSFAISTDKLVKLEPAGIEDYLDLLDDAGYLTFRTYEGLDGFYVTNPHMFSREESDYKYAEHVRVLNKAARGVRKEALLQLHRNINVEKQEEELETIARFISAPLDDMVKRGEISSGRVTVPAGQNILEDERLFVELRFVSVGYVREIVATLGMMNPNKR